MLAGTVYNTIVDTLTANSTLAGYIKYVFKGLRNEIEPDTMPCIVVEPANNNEVELDMNVCKKIWLTLDVIAYSYCPADNDSTIVGQYGYKGILDLEQDIKACLQSSNTLGDTVIDIQFEPTVFEYQQFPVRGMMIPVRVLYEQENSI